MAEDEVFEGLLATLTTEQGKEDLVREAIERDEGARVNNVKSTSTGYLVIGEPGPEGGSGSGGGGGGCPLSPDDRLYWTDIHDAYGGFDIPINELGKTRETRIAGIKVIKAGLMKYGLRVKDIADKEKVLQKYHDGSTFNHIRTTSAGEWWEGYCTEALKVKLTNLYNKLKEKQKTYPKLKLPLKIISGYRRLGTDVDDDPSGERDSHDKDRGHWLGESVDLVNSDALDYTQHIIDTCFKGSCLAFEKFLHQKEIVLCRPWISGEEVTAKEKNHITHYNGRCRLL